MARTKYSFWPDVVDEEYFIIKLKNGIEKLTARNAIHDHISNSIYQAFRVRTANLFIGYYQEQLALFSKVLPGYKDLVECLNSKNALEEINQHDKVDDCVAAYKKLESGLSICGKEALLAAAIILEDMDVLGAGLRNIGLIKFLSQHQIIKIDPSDSIFDIENIDTGLKKFEANLSLDNPLIYAPFSFSKVCNNPQNIMGNLHFSEFFHDIDKEKLKDELARFASLDDAYIKKLIIRDEYLELLPMDDKKLYLEQLANILIRKKAILKKALHLPEIKVSPLELAPVFIKDIEFSEPLEKIQHGASRPFKVKRVAPAEDLRPDSDECAPSTMKFV
ncbi:Uncharacterised protein [Legionella steigerwaltii]|uniref:Uncharacterized protein n=1 Tax=Legionella steigerwaltii TaxID=460 RepID=A0A378L7K5_9GAMM|nr:hypothetical protein [Legionella steigerwaltii]KTD76662.1 hypothetical protein Lstg_2298 [Legionella steigerwaltii]STY22806.1 Uncharacterised protein [Legionella steigerwaltii]